MATEAVDDLRLHERSIAGVSAGIVCAVVVASICAATEINSLAQGAITAGAAGLPSAVEYSVKSRTRDLDKDASRLRRGVLRRPVGLVVIMIASGMVLWLLVCASLDSKLAISVQHLTHLYGVAHYRMISTPIYLISCLPHFFIAAYGSHYLGRHLYRWILVANGIFAAIMIPIFAAVQVRDKASVLFWFTIFLVPPVVLSLLGAGWGRRHRSEFLAKKLDRLEHKIARRNASGSAREVSAPAFIVDSFDQLRRLAELRDAKVISQDEFQTKKAEILRRI